MRLSDSIIKDIYWSDASYRRVLTLVMLFSASENLDEMATLEEGETFDGLISHLRRKGILQGRSVAEQYRQLLEKLFEETYRTLPNPSAARQLKALFDEANTFVQQAVTVFESLAAEEAVSEEFFGRYYRLNRSRICLFPFDKPLRDVYVGAHVVRVAEKISGDMPRGQRFIPIMLAPRIPSDIISYASELGVDLYLVDAFSLFQLGNLVNLVSVDTVKEMSVRLREALLNQPAAGLWDISAAWSHLQSVPTGAAS